MLKREGSRAVYTGLVTELRRYDAYHPGRYRESPFRHYLLHRVDDNVSQFSHPAADNNHFRVVNIDQIDYACSQIVDGLREDILSQRVAVSGSGYSPSSFAKGKGTCLQR